MTKSNEVEVGEFRFNQASLDLQDASGRRVPLRAKSAEVLACLAARPGEIVPKAELIETVWPNVTVTDESLTRCIADIRKAIGDTDQTQIETHVGKGYSLSPPRGAPKPRARIQGRVLAGLVALLALAGAVWVLWTERTPDGPTRIAVLAFDDLSPGADNGYLGDGIAEGIITELARYPELAVVARNSSFSFRDTATDVTEIAEQLRADYVLEGSLQKSGNRLKVTVQLIDGRDGIHQWAHDFDTELDDYFEMQTKIILGVATQLGRKLAFFDHETGSAERVSALNLYQRGNSMVWNRTHENTKAARDLYLQAIEVDPNAPYGHMGMALIAYLEVPNRWIYPDMTRDEILQMGIDHAERALELAPNHYMAHISRGDMHDRAGEAEQAIVRYQNAAALNPSSADALVLAAEPMLFLDRADEAIALLERAIDINPIPPAWYYKSMSFALWSKGDCEAAVTWSKKRARPRPWDLRHLMVAQACAGDLEGARATAARHLEVEPDYTVRTYRERNTPSFKNNPAMLERFLADLAKAGMPEG